MNTMETTEEVSLHPGENGHASQKKHRNTPGAREKPWANWKKGLAILWSRKRITKTPTLVVGKKPYGKCQLRKPTMKKSPNPIRFLPASGNVHCLGRLVVLLLAAINFQIAKAWADTITDVTNIQAGARGGLYIGNLA